MTGKWQFDGTPIGEPLCTYDGTQESMDNCVAMMCANLGIELKEDGEYPGEMIMVALWARILQLQGFAEKTALVGVSRKAWHLNWTNGGRER